MTPTTVKRYTFPLLFIPITPPLFSPSHFDAEGRKQWWRVLAVSLDGFGVSLFFSFFSLHNSWVVSISTSKLHYSLPPLFFYCQTPKNFSFFLFLNDMHRHTPPPSPTHPHSCNSSPPSSHSSAANLNNPINRIRLLNIYITVTLFIASEPRSR